MTAVKFFAGLGVCAYLILNKKTDFARCLFVARRIHENHNRILYKVKLSTSCFQVGRGIEEDIWRGGGVTPFYGWGFWDHGWRKNHLFQEGFETFSWRGRDCRIVAVTECGRQWAGDRKRGCYLFVVSCFSGPWATRQLDIHASQLSLVLPCLQ